MCAGLCGTDDFGLPCASGGTCVEHGQAYGVCTPEAGGGEGGAGGAGG